MRPVPVGIHLPCAGQEPAVRRAALFLACWLALLAGCARLPGPAAPPPYRGQIEDHPAHYVFLGDAAAARHMVAGISREIHDGWRWAGRLAALRFAVDETQGVHFQAVLTVPAEFVRAGGRTIEVWIDGRPLGSIPAGKPGYVVWKEPVPEAWLERGRGMLVELVADADWVEGGGRRAYILSSAGFTL